MLAPPAGDAAALRGTRFEFGGRRPYSFPPPRITYRPVQRPLPGIGTVALGKVARLVPYGAFVDFLGFRGLVHVSQLLPGQRVERVEDVVQEGSEVVVRVIAIDPERRHINLTLVPSASGAVPTPAAPGVQVRLGTPSATAPDAVVLDAVADTPPSSAVAGASKVVAPAAAAVDGPATGVTAQEAAETPAPLAPPVGAVQSVPTAGAIARTVSAPSRGAPTTAPRSSLLPAAPSRKAPPAAAPLPRRPLLRAAPETAPLPRGPLPRAAPAKESFSKAAPARGVAKPPSSSPPIPPPISQHGARAVRREMSDPSHPMARLLAAAGDWPMRPGPAEGQPAVRDRRGQSDRPAASWLDGEPATGAPGREGDASARASAGAPGGGPGRSQQETPGSGAGNSGVTSPATRQVHVAEPEPEPAPEGPATLEALAARYAHRAGPAGEAAPRADEPGGRAGRSARERSRQERDKQAAILARLRTGQ